MKKGGNSSKRNPSTGKPDGRYRDSTPVDPTVADYAVHVAMELRRAPRTVHEYARDVEIFGAFLAGRDAVDDEGEPFRGPFGNVFAKADTSALRRFIIELTRQRYSAAGIRRKLAVLRGFFGFLKREGKRGDNPALEIANIKLPQRLPKALDVSEVLRLIATRPPAGEPEDSVPFDPTNADQLGWTEEIALDVQLAHAIAPGASIILVAAASDSFDDILAAQNYAVNNRLGSILSESFGASELGLNASPDGQAIIAANEASFKRAGSNKMGTFVSAGDDGATERGGTQRVPQYPAASSLVTTVGGTNLFFGTPVAANPNGTYQGEVVWNDGGGAGGGGISSVFALPNFQQHLPKATLATLGGHRGYPDIAYNAGTVGGVIVHIGTIAPSPNSFFLIGGTSAGAPQWSAIGAIANQFAGHSLGLLNKRIYQLGRTGALNTLLHDVTIGNNNFRGVTGFSAAPGWDLATGWGTPNTNFVQAIAADDDDNDD